MNSFKSKLSILLLIINSLVFMLEQNVYIINIETIIQVMMHLRINLVKFCQK